VEDPRIFEFDEKLLFFFKIGTKVTAAAAQATTTTAKAATTVTATSKTKATATATVTKRRVGERSARNTATLDLVVADKVACRGRTQSPVRKWRGEKVSWTMRRWRSTAHAVHLTTGFAMKVAVSQSRARWGDSPAAGRERTIVSAMESQNRAPARRGLAASSDIIWRATPRWKSQCLRPGPGWGRLWRRAAAEYDERRSVVCRCVAEPGWGAVWRQTAETN